MSSEEDRKIAAVIVKRCGLRDGLFKGPRTLNAVETISDALTTARAEGRAEQKEVDAKIADAEAWRSYNEAEAPDAIAIAAAIREQSEDKNSG